MKKEKEITEFIGKATFDASSGFIFGGNGNFLQPIAEIRGWGAIQKRFLNEDGTLNEKDAEKFQDEMGQFIADAITEKIQYSQPENSLQEIEKEQPFSFADAKNILKFQGDVRVMLMKYMTPVEALNCACDITELYAQQRQGGWISVEDRLPEMSDKNISGNKASEPVLVYNSDQYFVAFLEAVRPDFIKKIWVIEVLDEPVDGYSGMDVTHWQPLPEPPKQDLPPLTK